MKKSLLTLGLLGLAGAAFAQMTNPNRLNGPWVVVNQINPSTPASYAIDQLVTLSPTFMWGIAYDGTSMATSPPKNSSVRANNAAGTQFDFTSIAATANFQPANISVPFGVVNPSGTTNTTAFCGQFATGSMQGGGGEVIRSTNGGASWRKISNNNMFAQPAGFCNWAYAFDVNNVVTGGDPNPLPATGPGQFEFWYSTNAGNPTIANITWTQCTNMPTPLNASEYAIAGSYTAVGNTIWAGTSNEPNMVAGPARVLKSIDRGHTWTVANTPMLGSVPNLAFKDPLNGIATRRTAAGFDLMWTNDGGLTWTMDTPAQMPDPTTADTVQGKLYQFGIAAIPGIGFMSYGDAVTGSRLLKNRGASFSVSGHGKTWTDVDRMRATYVAADFLACPGGGYYGYLGGFTDPATVTNPTGGTGGIFKTTNAAAPTCVPLATRNPQLQHSLSVSPNPSANGVFQLNLTDGIKGGTMLAVFDALGRQVLSRELSATASNSKSLNVDLSKEQAGVYTLRLTTAAGIATAKLVIE